MHAWVAAPVARMNGFGEAMTATLLLAGAGCTAAAPAPPPPPPPLLITPQGAQKAPGPGVLLLPSLLPAVQGAPSAEYRHRPWGPIPCSGAP